MNLTETVQALEAKSITVGINLGAHQHCAIDSNCPLAVELRRLMVDAGVTLEQLLEGYVAVTANDPVNYELPEIDGKVTVTIAGTQVELDLDNVIGEELKHAVDVKRRGLKDQQVRITHLGEGLYNSYLRAIEQAGKSPILPQLEFPHQELLESNCLVTCNGDSYIFLFPCEYKPEYTVKDGVRYKIAKKDVKAIRRDTYLEFKVRNRGFVSILLRKREGGNLTHYHGRRNGDCWGQVRLPTKWDGTLKSLRALVKLCMGSLATINMNSRLERDPPGMPHSEELQSRARRVGTEGTVATPQEVAVEEGTPPRGGWGARGTATLTEVEEYARRWGVATFDEADALGGTHDICAVCGRDFAEHNNFVCPRDFAERRK